MMNVGGDDDDDDDNDINEDYSQCLDNSQELLVVINIKLEEI